MSLIHKLWLSVFLILAGLSQAHAEFGNWFIADKRLSTSVDSAAKKISYRFTCQENMNLTASAVYCMEAVKPPSYRVSLQEDQGGLPSGTPLAASSCVPLPQSWSAIPMGPFPMVKGKVYHLVLEQDVKRGGGHAVGMIGPAHYAAFLSTDILNHLHPNDGSPDPEANTLYSDGYRWKELNQEPVYAIYGGGFRSQGNPYDLPGVRTIYGSGNPKDKSKQVLQGESLHFHWGFSATSFVIRVRKQGNPQTPLNYLLLKNQFEIHKALQVHKAVALAPDQVFTHFQWVTIGFDDRNSSNFSPECWFFAFQTDSGKVSKDPPGCEDCYLLSDVSNSGGLADAANFTFDGGAHLSRAVFSTDGGDPFHWMDDFESDVNVGAIGPDAPPQSPREYQSIPTPVPLEEIRDFKP